MVDGPNDISAALVVGAARVGKKARTNPKVARKNLEQYYLKHAPQYVTPVIPGDEDLNSTKQDVIQTPGDEVTGDKIVPIDSTEVSLAMKMITA